MLEVCMGKKSIAAAVGIAVAGVAARTISKRRKKRKLELRKPEESEKSQETSPPLFQGIDWSKI
jgi:hypothetical protein